jgi:WD40 repeat protein/transcriptional regulator with XRE-family HTH domain
VAIDETVSASSSLESSTSAVNTKAEFANQLSELRLRAGVPLRDLSKSLDVPISTLSGWMTGRHLPNLRQVDLLRSLLNQLGVSSPDQEHWVDALNRVRRAPGPRPSDERSPYRGLEPFGVDDAEWFFGRASALQTLSDRLRAIERQTTGTRMLVVLGASGSGKSSLLAAGLAAHVGADAEGNGRDVRLCTPGLYPFSAVAHALAGRVDATEIERVLRERPADLPALLTAPLPLLIIDQLEEVFTLVPDKVERHQFLLAIRAIAQAPGGLSIVVALRADFYAGLLDLPDYAEILQDHQIAVSPMSTDELQAVIIEPARRAGVSVQPELVDLLIRDFAPGRGHGLALDRGALPLLSHALLQTWQRTRRSEMTVEDYRAAGGLSGSVAVTADSTFDSLPAERQAVARELLLRLVNVDEVGVTTRRTMAINELDGAENERFEPVMLTFVAARLLTVDESSVRLSHESLIESWPRLRGWIEEERDGLVARRQLQHAVSIWEDSNRDPSALLSGGRLEQATTWSADGSLAAGLGASDREFLASSQQRANDVAAASKRRRRVLVSLTIVAGLLAAVATVSAVAATRSRNVAQDQRNQALSRRIALQADRLRGVDPTLAAELSLVGQEVSDTVESRSALLDSAASAAPQRLIGSAGATALAASSDGTFVAVSDDQKATVQLSSISAEGLATRTVVVPIAEAKTELFAVAISPDKSLLAAGGTNRTVALWSIAGGAPKALATSMGVYGGSVQSIAFSPDGKELAVGANDATIHRWSLADPSKPTELAGPQGPTTTKAVAYSPDGKFLATGGDDGVLHIWDLAATPPAEAANVPSADPDELNTLGFSPDGKLLAIGYRGRKVRLFTIANGKATDAPGPDVVFTSWVNSLSFSPDGTELTAGSSDSSVRSWNVSDWTAKRKLSTPAAVTGVAYVNGGQAIAATSVDGTVRITPLDRSPFVGPQGTVFQLAFDQAGDRLAVFPSRGNVAEVWDSTKLPVMTPLNLRMTSTDGQRVAGNGTIFPDGKTIAAGTSVGSAVGWDITDPKAPVAFPKQLQSSTVLVQGIAAAPNGELLAVGSDGGELHLWDMSNMKAPKLYPEVLKATNQILNIAFDPTSTHMAAASADKLVYLWDVADPTKPALQATLNGFDNYAQAVTFSDDGKLLAAGGADSTVRVWNVSDPTKPVALGGPLTGPQNSINEVHFQPGNKLLSAAAQDGTVWVWDLKDVEHPLPYATLRASTTAMNTVRFSPDGRYLAGSGSDKVVYLWDVDPISVRQTICKRSGDRITDKEWATYLKDVKQHDVCA